MQRVRRHLEGGIRTEVVLKADIRPGFTDTMTGKLERMEAQIKKQEEA